ncbi:MAG: hypothetical protein N2115_02255 [bacterium]|nr:hypothetical protein [bacterium]
MKKMFIIFAVALVCTYLYCQTFVEGKKKSLTDPKYEPVFVSSVSLIPSEVMLVNGRKFYYVFGATTGYEGKRLNFTPKGETNKGLFGDFLIDEYGNLFIEYAEFKIDSEKGCIKLFSKMVRVKQLKW